MCSRDLNIPLFEITNADLEEELTIGEDRGGRGGGRCSSYRRATFLQLNEMNSKDIFLSLSGFDITNNTVSPLFLNDCFGYHQIYITVNLTSYIELYSLTRFLLFLINIACVF